MADQPETLFDDAGKLIINPKTGLRKKNPNFLLEIVAKRNPEIQRSSMQMFMFFYHGCSVFVFLSMLLLYDLKRRSSELNSLTSSHLFSRHTLLLCNLFLYGLLQDALQG